MSVYSYKCPNCGAPLTWNPGEENVECHFCHSNFTPQEIEDYNLAQDLQAEPNDASPEVSEDTSGGAYQSYHCDSCGADVVCGDTTSAAFCYYCHSPVILTDRISGKFKPDQVIPFAISKEKAEQKFLTWAKAHRYVPKSFYSQSQLEKMTGIYLPVWLADVTQGIHFQGQGTKSSQISPDQLQVNQYEIQRQGEVELQNLVETAFQASDNISPEVFETIANYQWSDLKEFSPAYLSGFLAELWTVEPEVAKQAADKEAITYSRRLIMNKLNAKYENLIMGQEEIKNLKQELHYILAPAWILTYKYHNKIYLYALNGQTGSTYGELPIDRKKLWLTSGIIMLVVFILCMLGGRFLW